MVFKIFFFYQQFTDDSVANGVFRRQRAAGYQRVPIGQISGLVKDAVGASFGHPRYFIKVVRCQFQTFGNQGATVGIFGAAAALSVKVTANDIGKVYFSAVFIFKFELAATAAMGANGFPFGSGEF